MASSLDARTASPAMFRLSACSLLLAAGLAIAEIASPAGIKTCADDQPDVVECRRKALQQAVPLLAAGVPQLGAAPIDPLEQLPPLVWQGRSRAMAVKFRLDNVRFTGLGSSVVDSLQVDTANTRILLSAHAAEGTTLEGDYTMSGEVLGVPLDGTGSFKVSMNGGSAHVKYSGHLERGHGGQSYLNLDSVAVKLVLGTTKYELTGLFGDYKPLVSAANMFINSVSASVVQPEMLPALEAWLAAVYRQRAQQVFRTVPFRQLFPKTAAGAGADLYGDLLVQYL